jgi:isocitrate lyase
VITIVINSILTVKKGYIMSKLSDLQEIKKLLDVDFRKDKFLENSYNNSPCFGYDAAESHVANIHQFLSEKYGEAVIYNFMQEVERLRITTLKMYIESNIAAYQRFGAQK